MEHSVSTPELSGDRVRRRTAVARAARRSATASELPARPGRATGSRQVDRIGRNDGQGAGLRLVPPAPLPRRRSDASLLAACRRGNGEAWRLLVERYRRLIYSVPVAAYRVPAPDAEEIFQRVTVKLFENVHRLRRPDTLPAWLVTVTRNECRAYKSDLLRRRSVAEIRAESLSQDAPDVVRALHTIQREHRLALALESLDEYSRALLTALFFEHPSPSYAEIARRLDRPIGSIGPTRARCLQKLRRLYVEQRDPDDAP